MQKNEDIPTWIREASNGIIEHMNDDHSKVIVAILNGQYGVFEAETEMHDWEVFFEFW